MHHAPHRRAAFLVVSLCLVVTCGCGRLTPEEMPQDTAFLNDVDLLFVAEPRSQVQAVLMTSEGGVVVYRSALAGDERCDGIPRTTACAEPAFQIDRALLFLSRRDYGQSLEVFPSATTTSKRPIRNRLTDDAPVEQIDSLMDDVLAGIEQNLDTLPASAQPIAQKLKQAIRQLRNPGPDERAYEISPSEAVGCDGCSGLSAEFVDSNAGKLLWALRKVLRKNDADDVGEIGFDRLESDTGLSGSSVRLVTGDATSESVSKLEPPVPDFLCVQDGQELNRSVSSSTDPMTDDVEVVCSVPEDGRMQYRWHFGDVENARWIGSAFAYEGSRISFRPRLKPQVRKYGVSLRVTDRNTHLSSVRELIFDLTGGTSQGFFSCRSGSLCSEYSGADQQKLDSLRAQCVSSATTPCDRSSAKTCGFQANGLTSCVVTTNAPSNHDSECLAAGGTLGC